MVAPLRRSRAPTQRRRGELSFAGRVQRVRSADDALTLVASARSPEERADALERLGQMVPLARQRENEAAAVRSDARLARAVSQLAEKPPPSLHRCATLWALALLFPRGSEVPIYVTQAAREISLAMPGDLPPTLAAHALWGCDTLGIHAPPQLLDAVDSLPFRLHVGAAAGALRGWRDCEETVVADMVAELPIQRDVIASGSVQPNAQMVLEDRGTCWLSDSGSSFTYSGKVMYPSGALTPAIASVRDALGSSISRRYCSVLVNHYPNGASGMRFHSDPGQGPEGGWGYDTAVVSIGQARLFTFRRISDPSIRATFAVRHGDVLHMFDNCQELWQHSVVRDRPGRGKRVDRRAGQPPYLLPQPVTGVGKRGRAHGSKTARSTGASNPNALHDDDEEEDGYGGRISLVFKRTWDSETQLWESEEAARCSEKRPKNQGGMTTSLARTGGN